MDLPQRKGRIKLKQKGRKKGGMAQEGNNSDENSS